MTGRLRIGMIAPPWLAVPPNGYGGTEVVIDVLARALVGLGHEVVLFTTGDSTCPVDRAWVVETGQGVDVGGSALEVHHVVSAYRQLVASGVDVIHDHTALGPLYGQHHVATPIVTTNHNPFAEPFRTAFAAMTEQVAIVAISKDHARRAAPIPIAAVIHHGVDVDRFPVGSGHGGYVLFLGRLSEDKGAHRAVRIALAAGVRLLLAGRIQTEREQAYFDEHVRPFLGPDVQFVGEVDQQTKLDLLSGASALLNPIVWDEPFGMVMIEALACGTPVLAMANGAAGEIVEDGVTGVLATSEEQLIAALGSLPSIDRERCRSEAVARFSAARMAEQYLALYGEVIAAGRLSGARR